MCKPLLYAMGTQKLKKQNSSCSNGVTVLSCKCVRWEGAQEGPSEDRRNRDA